VSSISGQVATYLCIAGLVIASIAVVLANPPDPPRHTQDRSSWPAYKVSIHAHPLSAHGTWHQRHPRSAEMWPSHDLSDASAFPVTSPHTLDTLSFALVAWCAGRVASSDREQRERVFMGPTGGERGDGCHGRRLPAAQWVFV
jgi:hypothetical protein